MLRNTRKFKNRPLSSLGLASSVTYFYFLRMRIGMPAYRIFFDAKIEQEINTEMIVRSGIRNRLSVLPPRSTTEICAGNMLTVLESSKTTPAFFATRSRIHR